VALTVSALALPFALLALYARIRLRSRFRRSFPEVFIDPAAWSRTAPDHPDHHPDHR
jgi:hypothetical protein